MALNREILTANESLKSLSNDQIAAIETLSVNDENTVIGNKIGELHGKYDQDVIAVAGVQKNQGEKSYDFVKRVIGDFKTKATAAAQLETEIGTLKGQITDYEQMFKEGKGSEAIAQKLKDTETKLDLLTKKYDTDSQTWQQKEGQFATEMNSYKLNVEFAKATSGLKFKPGYPEDVQETLVESAKSKIQSLYKTDWVDNGKGGKVLVFRDEKGEIVRNAENKLEPFTAGELIKNQLKSVLDFGKKQNGTGTGAGDEKEDFVGELPDLGGATNQVKADEAIINFLMKKGYTRGSADFATEQTKIRKQLEVEKLPMR